MPSPDFWDFMMEGGYDLFFPDDEDETQTIIKDATNVSINKDLY